MNYYRYIAGALIGLTFPLSVFAITTQSQNTTTSVNPATSVNNTSSTAAPATSDASATSGPSPSTATEISSNEGILNCNKTSAYAMSVGSLSARGSIYVPTNDAAVTLNTGYLVYLACTLRPIVDRLREQATADLINKTDRQFTTGKDGNPMFSQNEQVEILAAQDPAVVNTITYAKSIMDPSVSSVVSSALARSWINQTRHQYDDLICKNPVTADTKLFNAIAIYSSNPACYALGAYDIAQAHLQQSTDAIATKIHTQLDRGQGTYPQTVVGLDGIERIVTPASVINAVAQQALTSGFRQTESATDIGQMVSSLFSGMGSEILANTNGLSGLTDAIGGGSSYLDRVSRSASQGVISAVTNAALNTLKAARQVEQAYHDAISTILNSISGAVDQVRGTERVCWNKVIGSVCNSTTTTAVTYSATGATCTTSDGATLHIATSTRASTAIISGQGFDSYVDAANNDLTKSQSALNRINRLISSIANTSSQAAQTAALSEYNQLVSQNVFHNQGDVDNLVVRKQAIVNKISQLLGSPGSAGNLQAAWGDGEPNPADPYDPNSGWCNVNKSATITMWQTEWSK